MTQHFRFASFTFSQDEGLRFNGKRVHLPPKEKGLLQALLEARGQVVRKDSLVDTVWRRTATSDESISRTVYRLRVAMLGCDTQEVIETVYNSGFRMAAAIQVADTCASSSAREIQGTHEPLAVAALLSAREYLARRSTEDIEAAASATRTAIQKDPAYAAAWSAMAEVRVFQITRSLRPPREAGWLAKEAAQSALRIDPLYANALAIRGWVRIFLEHDCVGGLSDLDQAWKNDTSSWLVALKRGWALQAAGRLTESVSMLRHAQSLNPLGHSINAQPAWYQLLAGDTVSALSEARSLAHRFGTIDEAQGIAATVCSVHGLHDEALAYARKATELAPNTPSAQVPLAYALAHAGHATEARQVLATIETSKLPQPSALTAAVHVALGEFETAIDKLTDACERGVPQFAWSRDDPRFTPLRGHGTVEKLWGRIWSLRPAEA